MKKDSSRSISRIRTFDEDIANMRGLKVAQIPKLKKKKITAQSAADTIINDDIHSAKDFIGDLEIDSRIQPQKRKTNIQKNLKKKVVTHKTPVTEVIGLEDEIKKVNAPHAESILTSESAVYDVTNDNLEEGTLITNKKNVRFRLFPAIISAVHSWFGSTTKKMTTPKKPDHVVRKAESRIETITAAARASKHAPQSDHGVVIKRLTKSKRKKVETAVSVKNKEDIANPVWGSSSSDQNEIENIQDKPAKEEVVEELEANEQTLPEPTDIVPAELPEGDPVDAQEIPIEEQADELPSEKVTSVPKESAPAKPTPQAVPQKNRTYRATPITTSGVPIYVYLIVILGASLLGIGTSIYWFISATPTDEVVIIRIPSLFTTDTKIPVELKSNRVDTLSTILDASRTSRETVLIYPTVADTSGIALPADAQTILSSLDFRAPGSFSRAITDITFGSYNGTDSFILMKVTNFDTAFGGLLEWEQDMSTDLSPLLGTPVFQSYDPYSRTDTQIRSAFFRDTVVSNKSARVLVDAQDNQRIVYAFVTPTLILITPNTKVFQSILPLVK